MDITETNRIRNKVRASLATLPKRRRSQERFAHGVKAAASAESISEFEVLLALYLASGNANFRKHPYVV